MTVAISIFVVTNLIFNLLFATFFLIFVSHIKHQAKAGKNGFYQVFARAMSATVLFFLSIMLIGIVDLFWPEVQNVRVLSLAFRVWVDAYLAYRLVLVARYYKISLGDLL